VILGISNFKLTDIGGDQYRSLFHIQKDVHKCQNTVLAHLPREYDFKREFFLWYGRFTRTLPVGAPYPKSEDADRMVATTAGLRENSNESSGATEGAELHHKLDT